MHGYVIPLTLYTPAQLVGEEEITVSVVPVPSGILHLLGIQCLGSSAGPLQEDQLASSS